MKKQSLSKLLSVILAVAICATTVFGCLITANAATDGTYTFGEAEVNDDATQATMDLTFEIPDGKFTAGMFTLNEVNYDAADHLTLVGATASNGINATPDTEDLAEGVIANIIVDAGDSATVYSSATITLTFGFSNGVAADGKDYEISVSDIEFAYSVSNYYTNFTGSNGTISAGCEHVLTVTGDPIKVDAENGVSVYENSVCSLCGEEFGYQVVPNKVPGKTLYWSGEFTAPTKTDADGTYIINTAEELAYIAQNGASGNYKVADGIEAFIMQPEGVVDADEIMALSSYTETKAYFEKLVADGADVKSWANSLRDSGKVFDGKFDGNGVSVYGMYCLGIYKGTPSGDYRQSSALFPLVSQATVISDVSVNNSYLVTGGFAGSIVGYVVGSADGMVNLEKCTVANCYVMSTVLSNTDASVYNQAGVVFGSVPYSTYKTCLSMQNCLVYGSYAGHIDGHAEGLWGNTNAGYGGLDTEYPNITVKNCIILDCVPYSIGGSNQGLRAEYFSNVYANVLDPQPALIGTWGYTWDSYITTKNSDGTSRIIEITAADAKGANAANLSGLDFDTVWAVNTNGGYPYFAKEISTISTDKNVVYAINSGGDSLSNWNAADGRFMDVEGGTNVGTGTKDDPFIISTPGHFRYLAQKATYATTHDKYFAVDPSIDIMVMQYESTINKHGGIDALLALDSAAAVQEFFGAYDKSEWIQWQSNTTISGEYFGGHLDGNGVQIVGMYNLNGALFGGVSEGTTITNITVSNSYINSADYGAALVGCARASAPYTATGLSNSNCPGVVSFEKITIKNNYIASTGNNQRAGALMGGSATYIGVKMNNCLVYGNDVVGLKDAANPVDVDCLFGSLSSGHNGDSAGYYNGSYTNSIILDCVPYASFQSNQAYKYFYYTNIYTNMPRTDYTPSGASGSTDWDSYDITIINTSDIEGVAAKDTLALDFENDWVLDLSNGYPTPKMPTSSVINNTSSSSLNLKAVNITYNDDGSFNINFYYTPAMADFVPAITVAKSDLSVFMTLEGTVLSDSEAANLGVKSGTIRYTIERLSAREIPDILLPTIIANNAGTAVWGKTEQISIRDYAIAVINGDYEQADKNVAAALINYGDTAKAALETGYDGSSDTEKNVVYAIQDGGDDLSNWNLPDGRFMDVEGGTNVGTGTKDDPFIISTPGHFRYLAQKATYATTHDKYFAVDPSIDIMVMQYESTINKHGGIDALLALDSGAAVQEFFEAYDKNEWIQWQGATTISGEFFGGHLDGNGVQIVGLYSLGSYALFQNVSEGASFSNITMSNCYVKTGDYASALVGFAKYSADYMANATNSNIYGYVSFDKIVIKNNYLASTGNNARVGVLMAGTQGGGFTGSVSGVNNYIGISTSMTNCIVYGNKAVGLKDAANPVNAGLFGSLSTGHSGDNQGYPNGIYHDSIILGCVPYGIAKQGQAYKPTYYKNIYTDTTMTYAPCSHGTSDTTYETDYAGKIISIGSAANATGSAAAINMPDLDWKNTWVYGLPGEYPTFISDAYETKTAGEIWYWDGSYEAIDTTAHAGTEDDPYIIENAKQLNYIAMIADVAETTGKHYKIADGVAAIVLQSSGADEIMALDSGSATKAYFESITPTNWMKNFSYKTFNGSFDGNNVPIYGLYVTHTSYHIGLFPQVDGGGDGTGASGAVVTDYDGVTYKNIIVRNSYYISTAAKRVGGIVGHTYGNSGAAYTSGTLNFDKVEVSNCYMSTNGTGGDQAGILSANLDYEIIKANNVLIYGNETLTGNGVVFPVFGSAEGSRTLNNDGKTWIHNTVENSIVLGATPYNLYKFGYRQSTVDNFENVYTDALAGTVIWNVNSSAGTPYTVTFKENDIKQIAVSDAIGEGAAAAMNLDWNTADNTTGIWYTGNAWGYPAFSESGIMPSITQNAYDALSLTNYDEYGETNPEFSMYASSLNLKTNPYIAFTFAFNGDYKANRDNITVTFKTASETITTTVGDDNGGVNSGWTNNEGAGRYHLYRLEGISVEDMCKDIQVTVTYGGTDYNFGTFSVEGFALEIENANKQDPCDYYATRAEAAKALLFYTQMVNARYGA